MPRFVTPLQLFRDKACEGNCTLRLTMKMAESQWTNRLSRVPVPPLSLCLLALGAVSTNVPLEFRIVGKSAQ
jgi:hypothetical protein